MRYRAVLALVFALAFGLQPAAQAHEQWDVWDTCSVSGGEFFYLGGPSQWWFIHRNAGGATEACHEYTHNSETRVYNYADWYVPTISCSNAGPPRVGNHNDGRCIGERYYTGTYQFLAWLVRESHFTTRRAQYQRYAYGLSRGVSQTYVADQSTAATGNKLIGSGWIDTRIDLGYRGFMRLIDYTAEPSQSRWVGVDRMYYWPVH